MREKKQPRKRAHLLRWSDDDVKFTCDDKKNEKTLLYLMSLGDDDVEINHDNYIQFLSGVNNLYKRVI